MSSRLIQKKDAASLKAVYQDGKPAGTAPDIEREPTQEELILASLNRVVDELKSLSEQMANKPPINIQTDNTGILELAGQISNLGKQVNSFIGIVKMQAEENMKVIKYVMENQSAEYDFVPERDGRGLVKKWKARPITGVRQ
jgi:hypothetical protein